MEMIDEVVSSIISQASQATEGFPYISPQGMIPERSLFCQFKCPRSFFGDLFKAKAGISTARSMDLPQLRLGSTQYRSLKRHPCSASVRQTRSIRIGSRVRLKGSNTRPRISKVTTPRSASSSPGSPRITGVCPSPWGRTM